MELVWSLDKLVDSLYRATIELMQSQESLYRAHIDPAESLYRAYVEPV